VKGSALLAVEGEKGKGQTNLLEEGKKETNKDRKTTINYTICLGRGEVAPPLSGKGNRRREFSARIPNYTGGRKESYLTLFRERGNGNQKGESDETHFPSLRGREKI